MKKHDKHLEQQIIQSMEVIQSSGERTSDTTIMDPFTLNLYDCKRISVRRGVQLIQLHQSSDQKIGFRAYVEENELGDSNINK